MCFLYSGSMQVPASAIDSNQHVNNLAYLHWIQRAALAHSEAHGWGLERCREHGWSWVVRKHEIDYLRPAFAGETLQVVSWVSAIGNKSLQRHSLIWRPADQQLLVRAHSTFVSLLLASGRSSPIGSAVRQSLQWPPGREETRRQLQETPEAALAALAARMRSNPVLDGVFVDLLFGVSAQHDMRFELR